MDLQQLRIRLRAAKLTQKDVAARLGRAHSQVSRMLSGQTRMRVDTLAQIESLLHEAESRQNRRGELRENSASFEHRIKSITLNQAKAAGNAPRIRLSDEERSAWLREMRELGDAGRRMPRVRDASDDDILGYDEAP